MNQRRRLPGARVSYLSVSLGYWPCHLRNDDALFLFGAFCAAGGLLREKENIALYVYIKIVIIITKSEK